MKNLKEHNYISYILEDTKKIYPVFFVGYILAWICYLIAFLITFFIAEKKINITILGIIIFIILILIYLIKFYMTKNRVKTKEDFSITKIQIGTQEITDKGFKKACTLGGVLGGLIGSLIIFISYINHHRDWIGYNNMDPQHFIPRTILIILVLQICLGAFLGYVCGINAWPTTSSNRRSEYLFFQFLIVICGFLSIVIMRQLMARDALVFPNGYIEGNGQKGGGPLGEPDFETLATGLSGGISFLILVYSLLRSFKRKVILTKRNLIKQMIKIAGSSAILGLFAWLSVLILYKFLIGLSIIQETDVIYKRWIFVSEFPHPERTFFFPFIIFIYILSMLLSILFFSHRKSKEKLQFNP